MNRLKKTSQIKDLNVITEQLKDQLSQLNTWFAAYGDGRVEGFIGKVAIKCAEQYSDFDFFLVFDGENVTIINSNGETISEIIKSNDENN